MKDSIAAQPEPGMFAIVGMAARVPGVSSIEAFWKAVCDGRDLIRRHDAGILADNFTDAERAKGNYVPVRPALDDVDMFDAAFFNMLPREAALLDPQFRVFLETCWQGMEDAGYDPGRTPGPVGVFGGASMSTYFLNNVLTDRATIEEFVSTYQLGDYQQFMGAMGDTLATRVAFRMGLTGPAVTVSTACSTSLVAVAQACQSLDAFHCDMALAGGVSITFPQERGYFYQEGGMVSHDGHCRPFDAAATGTVFGHGAGVVALRRLEDALADDDRIYAVIRGSALNNDGNDKIAFTAPSVTGQAMVIAMAQGIAGVDPDSIGYVECHGTGTPLGDPIEFEGLKQAFAGVEQGRVALGSSKANIGHCDAAAGVLGLIKTALMLRDRVIPPLANYTAPNPRIDLATSPFRIPQATTPWVESGPLRAGISSMGVGGTNAHLVLEEAPVAVPSPEGGLHIIPVSACTQTALAAQALALADALDAPDAPPLADVALTLQDGRRAFDLRSHVIATTKAEAAAALRAPMRAVKAAKDAPPVAFMFPGQGAQYPGMAKGLYADEPGFAKIIDTGSEALRPALDLDLADLLYRSDDPKAAARVLRDTAITQPALYLIEYATARLWQDRGVTPAAMIGHSVGEFAAATLAGVMTFEAGLSLIAARGRLMQDQLPGAMLSVRAGADVVADQLPHDIDIAARNAPLMTVVAGPQDAIAAFAARLGAQDIACRELHTSHAFHSAMMDPVASALQKEAASHRFAPPCIAYVSCVTGTWITDDQATDPAYWAQHCRAAVNFDAGVRTLCDSDQPPALIEVGPGRTLSAFAAQAVAKTDRAVIIQSLPDHDNPAGDIEQMAHAAGTLWSAGGAIDWAAHRRVAGQRTSLPGYPFEKARHWIDAPVPQARQHAPVAAMAATSMQTKAIQPEEPTMTTVSRTNTLTDQVLSILSDLSGDSFTVADANCTFLELGFDSLLLGQVTQRLARTFDVTLTFRQLMGAFPSVAVLVAHLDDVLPADAFAATAPEPVPLPGPAQPASMTPPHAAPSALSISGDVAGLMQAQTQAMLSLFDTQLQAFNRAAPAAAQVTAEPATPAVQTKGRPAIAAAPDTSDTRHDLNRRAAQLADFTPAQTAFIAGLCDDYSAKFPASKSRTQDYRRLLADPRTAAGFRPEWKELVFPVVAETAKGAYLTDTDGNTFIDLVNGFGQTAFGHSPDFVTTAVSEQMAKGFPIGPQTPLAHEVVKKFLAITGHDRATFCNTGSEAVMAAMRLARAVTGRETIVTFKGDYHGQFDEVLVKGRASGDPTALPAVSGVPSSSVANMVVLTYGTQDTLNWIADNAEDIAAVLVEPVQSRRPDHRPRAFCEEIRRITAASGTAMIMDEIVTGFRVAPGGMQQLWNITPDMATYGKVVGGGMPIGVLAGTKRFLDALDGGFWAFGDDSAPEVPPTFFAGTFVRHPLVLAAVSAVLDHVMGAGAALYDRIGPQTEALRDRMNAALEARGLPPAITGFSSWMIVNLSSLDPRAALIHPMMRLGGVHVHDGYPWFFTTAHAEADFNHVEKVFCDALDQLQAVGILTGDKTDNDPKGTQPAVKTDADTMPLTAPQSEVWMSAQMGEAASGVFTESASLRLQGRLNAKALQDALNSVIARHDALRLSFDASGQEARVVPELVLTLDPVDVDQSRLDRMITEDAARPFNLTDDPLVRATLARLAPDDHTLLLTMHHIVCDGWSSYLVIEELASLYNAAVDGRPAELPPPASFATYARNHGKDAPGAATEAFWKTAFPKAPDLPELPLDTRRGGQRDFAGATHVHLIDADLAKTIKRAAGREGVTLFGALAGSLAALLSRLSGSDDITLAVPTAGQTLLPDDRLVGHCVNLLPIRLKVAGDAETTLADHLKAVSTRVLDCFDHGDTTYGSIVHNLASRGDLARQPFTEVQFNLDQQPDDFGFDGIKATLSSNPRAYTNFDLIFNVTESRQGLRIDLTYATDVLCAETVARWCAHYQSILETVARDMQTSLQAVPLIGPAEAAALAAMNNDTARVAPKHDRLEQMIAAQTTATPDAIAVEDANGPRSYATLATQSDRLAAEIHRRIPQPGQRVAVMVERSADMLVALLAVLKAGHAYVPLDPHHPTARHRATLTAASVAGLVYDGDVTDAISGLDLAAIRASADYPDATLDQLHQGGAASDAAYVIFTSGSTGTPKGVEVSHGALLNFLTSMAERPGLSASDAILSVTTVSFDIAGLELFLPLTIGAKTVIATDTDVREAFPLVDRLAKGDITVLQATPTLWQMLLEAGLKPTPALKILTGGEPLPRDLAERLVSFGGEVWNMYGPTETTIWSSCSRVTDGNVTIGDPIANTVLHVMDDAGNLVPPGVTGELNIGGAGLAIGYLHRPDLTDAAYRSVDVPGAGPTRLYRTGDLAQRRHDGTIRLLGRRDGQIKLRGFRIELSEIEAAMRSVAGIRAAAVDLRDGPTGPLLAGFYVADKTAPPVADITAALTARLPAYMVPQRLQAIDALPETGNGKLDRRALPPLDTAKPAPACREVKAPETDLERDLVTIWQDVLGLDDLSTDDSLFDLGVDSLGIFRIAARMLDRDLGLEARHLMQAPTIAGAAALMKSREAMPKAPSLKDFRNGARRSMGVTV
ncbi:amino acid adenylation domain-containing protein [Loktanella salsilacus]|uniref:hybrid non-ribosomal peptide synthetase/type I polyketide synthase n=1 Tax=Loktanella salsilacus TaxID=195913 RepID=UPI003736CC28